MQVLQVRPAGRQDYEDEPLAWTYRCDALGEDWPTQPALRNALCYVCYIKEVLQWASSIN